MILEYISFTQKEKLPLKNTTEDYSKNFLEIDNASKRNLEIVKTLNGEKEGSLFHSVDYTYFCWKKRGYNDLENPLYSFEKINERLI